MKGREFRADNEARPPSARPPALFYVCFWGGLPPPPPPTLGGGRADPDRAAWVPVGRESCLRLLVFFWEGTLHFLSSDLIMKSDLILETSFQLKIRHYYNGFGP